MVTWCGDPPPRPGDVESAIEERSLALRSQGLRSVTLLPEEGRCSAVMVLTCEDTLAAAHLAASILPPASVYVESVALDDEGSDGRARAAAGRHGYGSMRRATQRARVA
jgi:hypothetical protein